MNTQSVTLGTLPSEKAKSLFWGLQGTRVFPYLLVAIALGALVPLLVLGRSEFISYDGYWYLFIDTQNRWDLFLSEYRSNAHPIVYQLLLRIIAHFGHSRLLLRSASIVPGAAGVVVMGLLARRLYHSKTIALLAAAAYGFSMTMIGINIDVRSYPLCLLFVLLAFLFLVDLLQDLSGPHVRRSLYGYAIFTSLAIGTEYYAIFFFLACLSYFGLLAGQARFRRDIFPRLVDAGTASLSAVVLPFATAAFFYWTHFRYQQPGDYGHLAEFYLTRASPPVAFIVRNLRADLNYILPFKIGAIPLLLSLVAALLAYSTYFGLFRRVSLKVLTSGVPSLMVVILLGELIFCSLVRKYPFGGFERQQSIFFPFLLLAGFMLVDQAVSLIPARSFKVAVALGIALWIALNFRHRWQKTPRDSVERCSAEYQTFVRNVPPAEALYVDQYSLIAYYIHTHQLKWEFYRHFREPDRVDEYRLIDPSGKEVFLLRDLDQWNFDLHNPQIYQVLSRTIRAAQIPRINLFLLKQAAGRASPSELAAEEREVSKLAADAGLKVTFIYDDNAQAGVTFVPLLGG